MEEYESQRAARSNKTRTTTERYSPERMAKLKRILEMSADDGEPKFYSIHVDGMPVVEKTTDLDRFESYMNYFDHTTLVIELRMFYGSSPNCNTFFLQVGQQQSLHGVPTLGAAEINEKITEAVTQAVSLERMHSKIETLQKENARLEHEKTTLEEEKANLSRKLKKYKKLEEEARKKADDKTETREMIKSSLGAIAPLFLGNMGAPGALPISGVPESEPQPPPTVEVEVEREQSRASKRFEEMTEEYSDEELEMAMQAMRFYAKHPEAQDEFNSIITNKFNNDE